MSQAERRSQIYALFIADPSAVLTLSEIATRLWQKPTTRPSIEVTRSTAILVASGFLEKTEDHRFRLPQRAGPSTAMLEEAQRELQALRTKCRKAGVDFAALVADALKDEANGQA